MSNGESSKACMSIFISSRYRELIFLIAKDVSPAVDFAAGVVGGMSSSLLHIQAITLAYGGIGVAGLIVGQPFDVVKVRYQTPEYSGRYSSIRSAFGKSASNNIAAG